VLRQLGETWNIAEIFTAELERFVCRVYGQKNETSVNALRKQTLMKEAGTESDELKAKCNTCMDMRDLPLCKFVLFQHIKRPTYQTRIYKLAHKAYPVYFLIHVKAMDAPE